MNYIALISHQVKDHSHIGLVLFVFAVVRNGRNIFPRATDLRITDFLNQKRIDVSQVVIRIG